nr:hypothetical protein [uncultured Comamonas sp.]
MEKNSKRFVIPEDIFSELDPKDSAYPRRYRFFDADYARKNNQWIANGRIRSNLIKEAALAKIVFDYKKHYNQSHLLCGDFLNVGCLNFEFFDIFARVNILTTIAKTIIGLRKQNKAINFFGDFDVLSSYYSEYNDALREIIKWYATHTYFYPEFLAYQHPYIRQAMVSNDNDLLTFMEIGCYKKAEANFVRTANSNRQKINVFLNRKLIESKRIFICRLDVVLRDSAGLVFQKKCSIQNYKKQVSSFFERTVQFDYAFDVVFPSAIITGEMIPSNSPVGQIVLISTEKVTANQKVLKEFASRVSRCELLDFMPARPFPKDLAPNVDGVLAFTPSAVEAINWLSEFLTIERRFASPGNGSTDGSGTAHCLRFVDLKRYFS